LFVINVLADGEWWFYWPLIGWGIGLGVHALAVYGGHDASDRRGPRIRRADRELATYTGLGCG
jgi:hypothetical protein